MNEYLCRDEDQPRGMLRRIRRPFCALLSLSLVITSLPLRAATTSGSAGATGADASAALVQALQQRPAGLPLAGGQAATLMPDGKWLLSGGVTPHSKTSSLMLLYDPQTRKVAALAAQLQIPRSGHSATLLSNGTVLIWGGADANGIPVAQNEVFDPVSGMTKLLPVSGFIPRAYHMASVMSDGRVLISGGLDSHGALIPEAEVYNPLTGALDQFNAKLQVDRLNSVAALLPSADILVLGGVDGGGRLITSAEMFSALDQRFETVTPDAADGAVQSLLGAVSQPKVAAADPADGAQDIAVDKMLSLRFNERMDVASLNTASVTLMGPEGMVGVRVVPVEQGVMAFITPAQQLLPASHYTLFVKGAHDTAKRTLDMVSIGFDTTSLGKDNRSTETSGSSSSKGTVTSAGGQEAGTSGASGSTSGSDSSNAVSASTAGQVTEKSKSTAVSATDNTSEDWLPSTGDMKGHWWARRSRSSLQDLPSLEAAPGVTALAGQVLTMNGHALSNVTLKIAGVTTQTDKTGRFLLPALPSGIQVLQIDASSANTSKSRYGFYQVRVDLASGKTTALSYTIWMPRLDPAGDVNIPSPTTAETVVTTPRIPGLELHLPPGTVIRDRFGKIVTKINITAIPVDRPPFPVPDLGVPVYFTIQPGAATIENINGPAKQGARLIYPNFQHEVPGATGVFWDYDATNKGWYVYGLGHISADGKQAIPDPGVAIYQFTGAMFNGGNTPPPKGPPSPCGGPGGAGPGGTSANGPKNTATASAGSSFCPTGGDPVSLYTGQFEQAERDIMLPDVTPIDLVRIYNSKDTTRRSFGIGFTDPYDVFFNSANQYQEVDLILPNGGKVHYVRTSPGTSYSDAVFQTSESGQWYGSTVSWNGSGWTLSLRDGQKWYFSEYQPVYKTVDRNGNVTLITRRDSGSAGAGTAGPITRITSPNGRTLDFDLDPSTGVVNKITDNAGRSFSYDYDASGRLQKVTDSNGKTRIYTWDTTNNRITAIQDPNGITVVTNDSFDASGRVTQQTQADGTTFRYAYTTDAAGNVTQTDITDRRGQVRRVFFDANGMVTKNIFPLGTSEEQTTTFSYTNGLLTDKTDALGRATHYEYDDHGNMTKVTRMYGTAEAESVSATYDPIFSQPLTVTDARGKVTKFEYDDSGNLLTVTDPLSHKTTFTYDEQGRLETVTNALHKTVATITYDGADVSAVSDGLSRTTRYFTDSVGRVRSVTDPLGNTTYQDWDSLNRLTKITDALGGTTTFNYDNDGHVLYESDQNGHLTLFAYNSIGSVYQFASPPYSRGVETRLYEPGGHLSKLTDRKGQVSQVTYDNVGRLFTIGFGATVASPTAYTSSMMLNWDKANRLTAVLDLKSGTAQTTTRSYDDLDRLTSEVTPLGEVDYTYYPGGLRKTMTVKNGAAGSQVAQPPMQYFYDDAGRFIGILQLSSSGDASHHGAVGVGLVYDDANRVQEVDYVPGGASIRYTYSDANEVKSITYVNGSGTTLGTINYTYDAAGRRINETGDLEVLRQVPTSDVTDAIYNEGNQLIQWAGKSYSYDKDGNLTSDGVNTYTWNERNQLVGISGSVSASFGYDAFGRRSGKTIAGAATGFVYDGDNFVQELNGLTNTATVKSNLMTWGTDQVFFRSVNPTGTQTAASVRWFMPDANNNTMMLTDGASGLMQLYGYEPYGRVKKYAITADDNTQQYTGRENDGTGLYYYRNRYYMPTCARFISEDPIGWASGQTNNYAYVGGNPVQFGDPYGTCDEPGLENVCVICMVVGVERLAYVAVAKAIPSIARSVAVDEAAQAAWANAARNKIKDIFRWPLAKTFEGQHQPSVEDLMADGKTAQEIISSAGKTNGMVNLGAAVETGYAIHGGNGTFQPGCY